MNYSAWSGDSNCVPNWFRSHGRRQQSGPWLDLGRYRRNWPISKGRSGSPAKSPTPPPRRRAAQEALPQAPAPAEVAHPIPNQEVAALRRELHGLINPKGGSVVSKGRVEAGSS
uniref:Uncharacterized protein n=1 Tax=Populus alba TaxID=43335 RepID=A0A4U5QG72_POPAL|nr:hypothetical protein D5086_0000091020 [Populus alba]